MPQYRYLIVGAGMTGDAAAHGIRELDAAGPIALLGAEPHPPYNRPPLSKGLWKGDDEDSTYRKPPAEGVELRSGRRAVRLDLPSHRLIDDLGEAHGFEKLLLATGGVPRRVAGWDERVIYYRTLDDYRRLRDLCGEGQRFAVIGGGFIGSEVAAALAMNGERVALIFPDPGIAARVFPRELAEHLAGYYRDKGVEVHAGEKVEKVEAHGELSVIHTASGAKIEADAVIAGLGIQPSIELAVHAGLAVDNGIVVDGTLRTSHPDVFAAGDVANFLDPALGKRVRVEHEDNANTMGRHAGRAMAGDTSPYQHQPFFYSDLFDLGYEAVGDLDSRLETVVDWVEPFRQGVIYYLADRRVRGVLLWNTWEKVEAARALIADKGPFKPADLKGRIRG
jgi:NADPH-dependent 2,4-dienoyl-CoA reductase/sulfur reductase-like enzyme